MLKNDNEIEQQIKSYWGSQLQPVLLENDLPNGLRTFAERVGLLPGLKLGKSHAFFPIFNFYQAEKFRIFELDGHSFWMFCGGKGAEFGVKLDTEEVWLLEKTLSPVILETKNLTEGGLEHSLDTQGKWVQSYVNNDIAKFINTFTKLVQIDVRFEQLLRQHLATYPETKQMSHLQIVKFMSEHHSELMEKIADWQNVEWADVLLGLMANDSKIEKEENSWWKYILVAWIEDYGRPWPWVKGPYSH